MTATALVFLYPGQAAYAPGVLETPVLQYAAVAQTLEEVDEVARAQLGRSVRQLLIDRNAPASTALEDTSPELLDLATFAISVCTHQILEAAGCEPSILVGHGLGEIAALVGGGALTAAQGAAIVTARARALKLADGLGYMAFVGASPRRCTAILEALETPQANVAIDNGPDRTVMSGSAAAMDRVAALVATLDLPFTKLPVPYPLHSLQLVPAAKAFRGEIAGQIRKGTRTAVYSPILERTYEDRDDLATALSSHLIRPIRFSATVRHLRQTAENLVFVEVGASSGLLALAQRILNGTGLAAFPTLFGGASALRITLDKLRELGLARPEIDLKSLQALLPSRCSEQEFQRFWESCAAQVMTDMGARLMQFRNGEPPQPDEVPRGKPGKEPSAAKESRKSIHADERPPLPTRSELIKTIVRASVAETGYPLAVFSEQATFSEQLGVDKPKHRAILQKLLAEHGLEQSLDAIPEDVETVGQIADWIMSVLTRDKSSCPARESDSAGSAVGAREPGRATPSGDPAPESLTGGTGSLELLAASEEQPGATTTVSDDKPATDIPVLTAMVPLTRDELLNDIVAVYSRVLQCPAAVLREDASLSADLGVDPARQIELMAKLYERYRLPGNPTSLSGHDTLTEIADHVYRTIIIDSVQIEEHITAVPLPTVAPAFVPADLDLERERTTKRATTAVRDAFPTTRAELRREIVTLFAEAMDYPPEVFTEDVDLESELGIDSVRQMEILGRLEARYGLAPRPEANHLRECGSLRRITDFVYQALNASRHAEARRTPPLWAVG